MPLTDITLTKIHISKTFSMRASTALNHIIIHIISMQWSCSNIFIGASFLPLSFEAFGRISDNVLLLIRDLVGKAAESNQLSFSRLFSHWKRRFATILQKENALLI